MKLIPVMSRSFAGKFALGSCLVVMCSSAARSVLVAEQRGPVQRTVQGKVTDGGNAAVNGAVVYLKDDRSLAVKSYITDSDGTYRFGQLAQSTDYELWAESNGKKSSVKSISSFDSKNQFYIDLKIGK
jgi:Carboxypeptidase regulatory-like domain